jgi:hypothetical protein
MSTTIRRSIGGFEVVKRQDFMVKRFALLAIRLLVSVNLLYAVFFKFAGVPGSVTPVHADVASGPRIGTSAGIPARHSYPFSPDSRERQANIHSYPLRPVH